MTNCTQLSKYLNNPSNSHWKAGKHVLRYLAGTKDIKLSYKKSESFSSSLLIGYSDADWAGNSVNRRSTSGFCYMLGGITGAVSWSCKTQPTVALSTAEAEYMCISSAAQEGLYLQKLLADCGQKRQILVKEDNQACIALVQNPVFRGRSKHIDIKHHFIRDLFKSGILTVEYLSTENMTADILTKLLGKVKTTKFRQDLMGLVEYHQ